MSMSMPPDGPQAKHSPHWTALIILAIVLGLVALVLLPVITAVLPGETARWYEAAAEEQALEGNFDRAVHHISQAIHWDPERRELYLRRAQYHGKNKNLRAALSELNRLIDEDPEYGEAYFVRADIYQQLGQHRKAVEDWKAIYRLAQEQRAVSSIILNGLAYSRALAGVELEQALEDAKLALEQTGQDAAILDTRGYVYYKLGDLTAAEEDLEQAVQMAEQELREMENSDGETVLDPRVLREQLEFHRRGVAVMRYHRALVYQQQGRSSAARRDLQRVRELGFEPGEELF